jgi:hypothetical protein
MVAPLIIGGAIALIGGIASATAKNASTERIFNDAQNTIQANYNRILGDIRKASDKQIAQLKEMFPQLSEKLSDAFKIEENPAFRQLKADLDQQKELLIDRLRQSKDQGKQRLRQDLARLNVQGARASSQLRRMEDEFQKQLGATVLQQNLSKNQLTSDLINRFGLAGAQAQAGLVGQEASTMADAFRLPVVTEAQLGGQLLNAQAGLTGQQAVADVSKPSGQQQLGQSAMQVGGGIIGRELATDPKEGIVGGGNTGTGGTA